MKIIFACDHAGFTLKEQLKEFVATLGHDIEDVGALEYNESDNYTDFVPLAAQKVSEDSEHTRAIVLGMSGQGEAIAANRFSGVRAVVYIGEPEGVREQDVVTLAREHNNANVLSLGAYFLGEEQAKQAVQKWLETPFSNDERHIQRNKTLDTLT